MANRVSNKKVKAMSNSQLKKSLIHCAIVSAIYKGLHNAKGR